MKVIHIITGLGMGGAEMMLSKILKATEADMNHVVISLTSSGEMGKQISEAGFKVISLEINSVTSGLKGVFRLARHIRAIHPDVIQTWMYHADFIGGLVAWLSGYKNIIWNIRNSDLDPEKTKFHTRLTVRLCAVLSKFIPKKIISNSSNSAELHQRKGYKKGKFEIIPNGFDLNKFVINEESKQVNRVKLGIVEDDFLIGFVARFDPQKDHQGFIQAAKCLKEKHNRVRFLLCGSQMDNDNQQLNEWISSAGLEDSFKLLGLRSDVEQITTAFDLATLSSAYGEAFPNVIGEAMSCGIPCVVTNVGDSAWIVADTGRVVEPNDPRALADAWEEIFLMSKDERATLGFRARKRIEENFSIEKISQQYFNLYKELAS